MKTLFALLASLSLPIIASAQVRIVDAGPTTSGQVALSGTYTQNFDSLVSTTTVGEPWTNNTTLPGWYAYRYGSESPSLTGIPPRYYPSTGWNPSALISYGKSLNATDRALGAIASMGEGSYLHFGMQFSNDSSQIINGLTVTFDGERWYSSGIDMLSRDSLVFSYQIFDAGQGALTVSSGWTTVDSLAFYSPSLGYHYNGDLDGNLPENRVADLSAYIADIALGPVSTNCN